MAINKEEVKRNIQHNYGKIAVQQGKGCGSCCGNNAQHDSQIMDINGVSLNLGYTTDDLLNIPENANMGLGCGNPLAIAGLKVGETVLDLGSGGGFDCFLARRQVGDTGYVIGVDMTPEMIELASKNVEVLGYTNVEFRTGYIENLPVEDTSIDVIISNCVINLSVEKEKVFKEAYRVLKIGGRLSISDILATAELPEDVKNDISMISGCVAGAEYTQDIFEILKNVGFDNIQITPKDNSREILKSWMPGKNIEEYVASFIIEAYKL